MNYPKIISPSEENENVTKLLNKLNTDFEPEIIPVLIDENATMGNCFINVEKKVKKDGGKVHFGWAIFQSTNLCEAERHAVWENEDEELIDITPREILFSKIMFVSDNDFKYEGQLVDNVRVNITKNKLVDDFIKLCEIIEKLYSKGERIDEENMSFEKKPAILDIINKLEQNKIMLNSYILNEGKYDKPCFYASQKNYKNCHFIIFEKNIEMSKKYI